jgi:hypothetical protein
MDERLRNQRLLKDHIRSRILERAEAAHFGADGQNDATAAAVLFLLGMHRPSQGRPAEPCLIFNKRSCHVRQPGDLCFPGGGLSPHLDDLLARLLRLPGFPLFRWDPDSRRGSRRPVMLPGMSRLLATSLRESFEEMRLNPFRIRFLGPMAPVPFKRRGRIIYPMVAWNCGQKTFSPNWEVDRIVYIPLRRFFHSGAYAKLPVAHRPRHMNKTLPMGAFPCLVYESRERREILWGLTYRIVMRFLGIVFDFTPPKMSSLPVVPEAKETIGHAFK